MALFSSSRPNIRGRVIPKFPAQVLGGTGIVITKANGVYTFATDWSGIATDTSIPTADLDNTFVLVWDSVALTYRRVGVETLVTSIGGALDPTIVSIAALTPTTDQGIYFSASDTAAVYSLTAGGRALGGVSGAAADKVVYFSGATTAAVADLTAFGRSLIDDATAAAGATTLGLGTGDSPQFTAVNLGHASDTTITRVSAGVAAVEGSNILLASGLGSVTQAFDATLLSIAALGTAADRIAYTSGVDTWAETPLTAFGRSLIDDAASTNARTTLGLVIGTDVQAQHARLADVAGITYAQGDILYYNGTNLVNLGPGTSGYFLKTQGAAANPVWAEAVGTATAASQAEQETGSSTTVFVTPGRQQFHASAAKFWIYFDQSTDAINASYNVTSVTDGAAGNDVINIGVDFSSGSYAVSISGQSTDLGNQSQWDYTSKAAGTINIRHSVSGSGVDAANADVIGFGDQ